jgi:hypothetical protein
MRRPIVLCSLIAIALLASLAPTAFAAPRLKHCATPDSFRIGPFFGDQVRARVVSCDLARKLAKRWGRRQACVAPPSPSDRVCRVDGYRCVYRSLAEELLRTVCKRRGTRKAVGFRFGS